MKIALKVKFKVIRMKPKDDSLLKFYCYYVLNFQCLQVIANRKCTYTYLTLKIALKVKFKVPKMKPMYDFP